jgi:hypothetical protein
MAGWLNDLRGAWRLLYRYRRTPVLILLTLGLGLAAWHEIRGFLQENKRAFSKTKISPYLLISCWSFS